MAKELEQPLNKDELQRALNRWPLATALDLTVSPSNFFFTFGTYLAKTTYTAMLNDSISQGRLPQGMTSGVIALIFKKGDRNNLSNWRPITLLNTTYKILAKALQICLQNLLKDVISPDQSAFLPGRYILDNVLLQYETIEWAKDANQDLIFLKLDFTKTFDTVFWDFLFRVMQKLGSLRPSPT